MTSEITVRNNAGVPDRVRTVRIPDELWEAAQEATWARREKAGPSAVMRRALQAYVADPDAFEAACLKIVGDAS